MSKGVLTIKQVSDKLIGLIKDCDVDTLAAIFESSFGAIQEAHYDDNDENIHFVFHDGFTENDL